MKKLSTIVVHSITTYKTFVNYLKCSFTVSFQQKLIFTFIKELIIQFIITKLMSNPDFFSELVENRWWDSSRPHNQNVSFPHADRLKAMDCTLQSQVFSSTNTQIFLIHARTSNVHIRFKPVFSISSTSRNFFASELVWALRSRLWVWKQPCSYLKTGRTCNIRPSVSIGPRAALANFD